MLSLEENSIKDCPIGCGRTVYHLNTTLNSPQVANTNVRNIGSIAGNLMLKYAHPDFPSDIFALLESSGAIIGVRSTNGSVQSLSPLEFLQQPSMDKKIVFYILMPVMSEAQGDRFM